MKRCLIPFFLVVFFVNAGCKKVVEIEETEPQLTEFCQLDDHLEGNWFSDSVHITTQVDTIDSTIINKSPTLFYEMRTRCGDEQYFRLLYTNFAGVTTEDINSQNFLSFNNRIFTFDPFEDNPDTSNATFRMSYTLSDSVTGHFWFFQKPNPGQVTRYDLFMAKE